MKIHLQPIGSSFFSNDGTIVELDFQTIPKILIYKGTYYVHCAGYGDERARVGAITPMFLATDKVETVE